MKEEVNIKKKLKPDALPDYLFMDKQLHKATSKCKESYIGQSLIRVYINNRIQFINFKKHPYEDYNKAILTYGEIERDIMLKNETGFDIREFKIRVYKRLSKYMLTKAINSGTLPVKRNNGDNTKFPKGTKKINIEEYLNMPPHYHIEES